MTNSKDTLVEQLRSMGLNRDEGRLYLELLREPSTHLKLAHATGINRTKVYRLADELEKRSLISKRTDDRGTFLVAADPSTLEVGLTNLEEKVKSQREVFGQLLPSLVSIKAGDSSNFIIHTYDGTEGFKQMLWHELKAHKECLLLGAANIDDLVDDHRWAEKHRARTVQAKYRVRELVNPHQKIKVFSLNEEFVQKYYSYRFLATEMVALQQQTAIYNDTVAIYSWREERKVGLEIVNHGYAQMLRQIFEHFWSLGKPPATPTVL